MPKPKPTLLATALALLVGVGVAQAQSLENSESVVMLPAAAMFAIEKNGKFAIISDTGRFIIEGKVYDVWAQKELHTLEDARRAAQYIPVDKTKVGFADLAPLSIGSGEKVITMFADPACSYCKDVMAEARESLPEGYRLDVLMLSILTPQSGPRATDFLCAEDKAAAWKAAVTGDMKTPLARMGECDTAVIDKRRVTAQFLGARNVPFLIRDDGLTRQGKPAEGLRAWIENRATL